jgi:hypothetical protein
MNLRWGEDMSVKTKKTLKFKEQLQKYLYLSFYWGHIVWEWLFYMRMMRIIIDL